MKEDQDSLLERGQVSEQPTVGERIRDEREWLGFTRRELAMALKLAEADVEEFEEDSRVPTADKLTRLAKFFRLDSVERLRGEPLAAAEGMAAAMDAGGYSADDRYEVQRFAEFLRNAGPPPNIDREATTKTRGDGQ